MFTTITTSITNNNIPEMIKITYKMSVFKLIFFNVRFKK